jgi:hypothetical protein
MSSGPWSCGTAAGRYLSGLCVSALGLCAGGWLVLTPFAFGYRTRGRAAVTDFATGGGLVLIALLTLGCWSLGWRRRLRADGVLPARPSRRSRRSARRQARAERLVRATRTPELVAAPDPAQVLTDLRALLTPLLAGEDCILVRPVPSPNGTSDATPAGQQAPPAPSASDAAQGAAAQCHGAAMAVPGVAVAGVAAADVAVVDVAVAEVAAGVPVMVPAPAPAPESAQAAEPHGESRQVQAPGHLRGTRSASFLAPAPPPAEPLLRGAELLMVGTGEEEAW